MRKTGPIAALMVALAPGLSPANHLYVSPTGAGGACSELKPCSLERAREKVRTLNATMSDDIVVFLRGGTYELETPFVLGPRDSGRAPYDVVYQAYPGETPVLSGGTVIRGTSLADPSKHIWKAKVDPSLDTRQLYVNGVRAVRARSVGGLAGAFRLPDGYSTTDQSIATWGNPGDIEFVFQAKWAEMRCGVAEVAGNRITMKQPCFRNSTVRPSLGVTADRPTYIENAYELLDEPGEWYLDRAKHTLYYIPRAGEDLTGATVVAPRLELLLGVVGTPTAPVRHIRFSDLTFAYATWLRPNGNDGFSETQANFTLTGTSRPSDGNWTKTPANVTVRYASHVAFTCNTFTHLGGAGLSLEHGSHDNLIARNVFTDISANGIQLGDVDQPFPAPDRSATDNEISNNLIHDLPKEYHGGVGIWIGYASRTLIAHNELFDLPYTAISNGWGWGVVSYAGHNRIVNNLVHDHVQLLTDGSGIYTNGVQGTSLSTGTRIEGNLVYNQPNPPGAIYLDDGSRFVTVINNLTYASPYAYTFLHTRNDPNIVTNNYRDPAGTPQWIRDSAGLEPVGRASRAGGCPQEESVR